MADISSSPQNINKLVMNSKLVRETPFLDYLGTYLDFISYVSNVHLTDAETRELAAKVFCDVFIKDEGTSVLKGRRLFEATIDYSLRWCFQNYKKQE